MYGQLPKYFDSLLATNQCGFRKGFRSQYCLLVMLERFKEAIEEISLGHFNQPFESIWLHWSQTSNCKAFWIQRFVIYLKCNFLLPETEHSQPKLMNVLVLDRILNTLFHNDQFWVHYFLILIWFTFFMNAKKMILQTMLTTKLHILVVLTFLLSFLNYRISQQVFNWFGNNHMKANLQSVA